MSRISGIDILNQIRSKKFDKLDANLSNQGDEMDKLEKYYGGEKRRVEVSMVEFDWIFASSEGFMFVEELANTTNDDLFKVKSIKICIEFLWQFYFKQLLICVFTPYAIFFLTFFVYSSVMYDGHISGFEVTHVLGSICLAYCFFAIILEVRQMKK